MRLPSGVLIITVSVAQRPEIKPHSSLNGCPCGSFHCGIYCCMTYSMYRTIICTSTKVDQNSVQYTRKSQMFYEFKNSRIFRTILTTGIHSKIIHCFFIHAVVCYVPALFNNLNPFAPSVVVGAGAPGAGPRHQHGSRQHSRPHVQLAL